MYIESVPSSKTALKAMIKADRTIAWRQRRAMLMTFLLPVIFVVSWKSLIPAVGAAGVLSICIAIGLPSVGLMAYPMSVARDRERGVFQRLRAAPIPTWVIMASRIIVQLILIAIMVIVTYLAGDIIDKISLPLGSVILTIVAGVAGGLSFLGLGQLVVGYVKSSESVNAVVRLLYFPFAILGAIGEIGLFGQVVKTIVTWSPFGTTQQILAAAMGADISAGRAALAFLITLGYGILFAAIGIRRFKWTTE